MSEARKIALERLGILFRSREPQVARAAGDRFSREHTPSTHTPVWAYENPAFQRPFANQAIKLFDFLPDDATFAQAASTTEFRVVLGAERTPQFLELASGKDMVLLIFEPSEEALDVFLDETGLPELTRYGLFIFSGDPYTFEPSLQDLLPEKLFRRGHPVFFVSERIRHEHGRWADAVTEYLEILYYRHVLYAISSHNFIRSHPFREITRELYYDQQLHLYENIPDYLNCPGISHLKGVFANHTAILVAAGPSLQSKLEFIRDNMDRAIVICVNNASKPLIEAGIEPHFIIINDPSFASGEVFKHLPKMPKTILVGHCLSNLGGDRFPKKYLFGDFMPKLFGERSDLAAHGSVISAAFSLARLMGCTRTVVVGGQLASTNPWSLDYVRGSLKNRVEPGEKPLIGGFPQLYPVTNPFGETLYTTLNFRDAALWLAEEIRISEIPCINTSSESILYGRGISHDPAPTLEQATADTRLVRLPHPEPPALDRTAVLDYLRSEEARWLATHDKAAQLVQLPQAELITKGIDVLNSFEEDNTSFLVQRFNGFDNRRFHHLRTHGDKDALSKGLAYYFNHVARMSARLGDLTRQIRKKL